MPARPSACQVVMARITACLLGISSDPLETLQETSIMELINRLNGLASPSGFEIVERAVIGGLGELWLNGLAGPSGFETGQRHANSLRYRWAKWPGEPVRV